MNALLASALLGLASAAEAATVVSRATSADGVDIAYTVAGSGEPALVFVHGAFADRSFWSHQVQTFSARHRTIVLDLGGHGESGRNRTRWDTTTYAQDVIAVLDKEAPRRAVLIGNSLGGPVALEAAAARPEAVLAVVGVDTFQSLGLSVPAEWATRQAAAYRADYEGTLRKMIDSLFHQDADPALRARVEARMLGSASREMAAPLMESYASFRWPRIPQPIRAINGDLFPIDVPRVRGFHADFDAVVLPHVGHYPMLEDPPLFDRTLRRILDELSSDIARTADERSIRDARRGSNEAFARHDAVAAAAFWTEDFGLVTSRDQRSAGRDAAREDLARHFRERPDVLYVRMPRQVAVYAPWGMASEFGDWEGTWTEKGTRVRIGGTYLAKWRKRGEAWVVGTEVFVPGHCSGGTSCADPPR